VSFFSFDLSLPNLAYLLPVFKGRGGGEMCLKELLSLTFISLMLYAICSMWDSWSGSSLAGVVGRDSLSLIFLNKFFYAFFYLFDVGLLEWLISCPGGGGVERER